jgi:ribosome-associated toxin RatA of RatAB toxin-antitoxin module
MRFCIKFPKITLILFSMMFCVAFVSACSNFRTYTEEERATRLHNGEILSYLKNIESTKLNIGESQAIIEASPARVWNAITDYNRQAEIGPRTKKIEITRIENDTAWVDLVLDAPWPMEDAVFTLKVDHDRELLRTDWSLVEGNIRESYGSWDIDPLPGKPNKCLATYTLLYDDGRPVPKWLVNTLTRQAVTQVMKILRAHVNDPIYDQPVYSLSTLNSSKTSGSRFPSDSPGNTGSSGPSEKEIKLDEETSEFLR